MILGLALAVLLPGCMSMTPARYLVSPDTREVLRTYAGSKVRVVDMTGPGDFNAMCRGAGNVRIADGMTIPQFVEKGFNDELRFASLHADDGVRIRGAVTKVEFSSSAALVNGWWDLAISLQSSNGRSMSVASRHDFSAGFDAVTACNNTSQALGTAVQLLVRKTVSDPEFAALVREK
jgi:hypothetical protein